MAEEKTGQQVVRTPRLLEKYRSEVIASLKEEFEYKNPMQVPKIEKISINIGLGEAVGNPNLIKGAVEELSAIAGQKAVVTRAKKSTSSAVISNRAIIEGSS